MKRSRSIPAVYVARFRAKPGVQRPGEAPAHPRASQGQNPFSVRGFRVGEIRLPGCAERHARASLPSGGFVILEPPVQIFVVGDHDGSGAELCRISKKLGGELVRTLRGEGYAVSD
jgi:hypothetical protein